jgi:mRNA interferase MazF
VVVRRGELWWADLGTPRGSGPGLRRPVLIVQADAFNQSRIGTVVVASLTTNLELAAAPGNVTCRPRATHLPQTSVINVSQLSTLDRRFLVQRIGTVAAAALREVEEGLRLVLGL